MEKQEKVEVLLQALNLMEKKMIKKSLHNTNINERGFRTGDQAESLRSCVKWEDQNTSHLQSL